MGSPLWHLILDPATSTGYAVVEIQTDADGAYLSAEIYSYGYLEVDCSSEFSGDHCINLMEQISTLIEAHGITHIAVEDYFFARKFRGGCNMNGALRTAIHIIARQWGLEYTIINISSWKTFVAGRATPTKEQKKQWGAEAAKKLFIQQALWERDGIRFPNFSPSVRTGKPVMFKMDVVDAVGQAVYYCGLVCGIPRSKITCSVIPPEDHPFPRASKKIFNYDDVAVTKKLVAGKVVTKKTKKTTKKE